jgi:thiamine-phosphate pyrophosphorylase
MIMRALRVIQISARGLVGDDEVLRRVQSLGNDSGGAFAVQLRDRALAGGALYELGQKLRFATRAAGAGLIVNDRLDLALALGADGIHLGRHSVSVADARALLGPDAWVSMSAHDLDDVAAGRRAGATAVLISPIFTSPGKGPALGLAALTEARTLLSGSDVRLFALGGVTVERAPACFEAGADGVAAIRADLTPLLDSC